jgi:hypothetical protein
MLAAIRSYIQTEKIVSEAQLLRTFNLSQTVLEPMLDILQQRQEIQEVDATACGQECFDCESPRYYQWLS